MRWKSWSKKSLRNDDWIAAGLRGRLNPVWWIETFLGVTLWSIQRLIVESVFRNPRTAVTACHAIGKTFITACIAIAWLHLYEDSLVLLTAPTYRQVKEVLWRQILGVKERAPYKLWGNAYTDPKWNVKQEWFMLGFSPQHPEKAQGFHAKHVLVILDEASGVNDQVLQALKGVMTSGNIVRLLLLGNPNYPEGALFDAFNSKREFFSPGLFQVSAWDTPNLLPVRDAAFAAATKAERWRILKEAPVPYPHLITPLAVAEAEEEYGEDSDFYRVRILGMFPKGGDDQLITFKQAMDALHRWERIGETRNSRGDTVIDETKRWWLHRHLFSGHVLGGLDVARFGRNESVWCARLDTVAAPLTIWTGLDNVDVAAVAADEYRRYQCSAAVADEDGMSGGFDVLKRLVPNVSGFRGGLAADNSERYANKRAEGYFGLQERFREGRIAIPKDDKLLGQLTCIKYKHRASGQKIIESKDDMEARGLKSPDRADALMMCFNLQPPATQSQPNPNLTDWSGKW